MPKPPDYASQFWDRCSLLTELLIPTWPVHADQKPRTRVRAKFPHGVLGRIAETHRMTGHRSVQHSAPVRPTPRVDQNCPLTVFVNIIARYYLMYSMALVYNIGYSRFCAIVYLSPHEAIDVHDGPFTSYARRCHRIDFKGGFAGTPEAGHALGGPHHSQAVGDGASGDRGRARRPETPVGRTLAGAVPGALGEYPLVARQGDRLGPPDPAEPDCRPVVARVGSAGGGGLRCCPCFASSAPAR